jgi:class 3 adenylate cyclase
MPEAQPRKLAAILAADIAGYSALMGADEARTVRDLKRHQAVVLPMIGERGGRIIDTAGDGFLAEFPSVVSAVECAVAVQESMAERNAGVEPGPRMQYRIGINIGDVIFDEARIYGDGINIAARLESIAEPGGIAVSRQVYDQVDGKLALRFRNLGLQNLKNIVKPVEVFAIEIGESERTEAHGGTAGKLPPKVHPAQTMAEGAAREFRPLRVVLAYSLLLTALLLVAHYVIIMKLDLNPYYLRAVSLFLPMLFGFVLFRRTRHGYGVALLIGAASGILSVLGMLAIVGLVDSKPIIPSSLLEWQESIEYPFGIMLGAVLGNALARAANSAFSAVRSHG